MFDISYHHLLQISCPDAAYLTSRLNCLADQRTGKIFRQPEVDSSHSEGLVIVFEPDGRRRCLGELTYLWISEPDLSQHWRLWLWIHPVFATVITTILKSLLGLDAPVDSSPADSAKTGSAGAVQKESKLTVNGIKTADGDDQDGPRPKKARVEKNPDSVHTAKLEVRNVPLQSKATRFVNTSVGIELVVLNGTVNRFHLVGPLSAALLKAVCQPAEVNTDGIEMEELTAANSSQQRLWWARFYAEDRARAELVAQSRQLADLPAAGSPTAGVLGCTVRDPRLLLPVRKPVDLAKLSKGKETEEPLTRVSDPVCSPFFSAEIR